MGQALAASGGTAYAQGSAVWVNLSESASSPLECLPSPVPDDVAVPMSESVSNRFKSFKEALSDFYFAVGCSAPGAVWWLNKRVLTRADGFGGSHTRIRASLRRRFGRGTLLASSNPGFSRLHVFAFEVERGFRARRGRAGSLTRGQRWTAWHSFDRRRRGSADARAF